MTSLRGILPPILSGLLLALCFPPFHFLLFPFVALVPFALHLRALSGDSPGGAGTTGATTGTGGAGGIGATGSARGTGGAEGRRAFLGGVVLGVVYFGLLLHWLVPALRWLSPLGPLLFGVVVLILGGLLGGVAWAAHRLRHRTAIPVLFALPLAWTAGEWIRGHLPGGLAFPWLGLGSSLTAYPDVVGFAELVGARGVTFWLVLVNGLVAELLWGMLTGPARGDRGGRGGEPGARRWFGATRGREGRVGPEGASGTGRTPARVLLSLVLVVLVPVGWSLWRARTLETTRVARIALAQTDVSAEVKADPERALEATRDQLRSAGFGDGTPTFGDVDLLVWPETTFPFSLRTRQEEVGELVSSVAEEEGAPVLFGALEVEENRYNSAFFSPHPSGPLPLPEGTGSVYRKRFLVPLVERAPRFLPGLLPLPEFLLDGDGGELSSGGTPDPVSLPGDTARLGILICFESAFPAASRAYRRKGADVLVNLTNDVWFGDGSSFAGRAGGEQHAAHLVMRAVENRMGVARSANGGRTFFVDPVGRIHDRASVGEPAATAGSVETSARTAGTTLFTRTGDWMGPGSVLVVLVLLLAGIERGAAARRSPST